ncbi:hypothetical protein ABZZ36_24375 [Actinacidiphila glaucinigra]|uniref:hypothetical protein n=1 Tax=Actinacidiphila glaucinigra TaxID=235986 RepID=UPI0033ADBFC1
MTGNPYDTAGITLLEFDAGVRARPGMYFRYGQGDPRLPTAVLSAVAGHVLHPVAAVAPAPRPGTSVPSSAPRGSCPPLPRH